MLLSRANLTSLSGGLSGLRQTASCAERKAMKNKGFVRGTHLDTDRVYLTGAAS
jgi:hypothetical protein